MTFVSESAGLARSLRDSTGTPAARCSAVAGHRYDDPVAGYPLAYPPGAALLMEPIAMLPWAVGRKVDWRWWEHLPGNAYPLASLAVMAWLAVTA